MSRHLVMTTRRPKRPIQRRTDFRAALLQIRRALRLKQRELGEKANVSARTILRWECGYRLPTEKQHRALVAAVLEFDAPAAERLATTRGTSLVALGLVAESAPLAAAPDAPPSKESIELALYAAAEEMDIPAARVRAPMARLFRRLGALGLGWDAAACVIAPVKARSST